MNKSKFTPLEGFYHLTSESEPEPVLVYGSFCTYWNGAFFFCFNTHIGLHDVPFPCTPTDGGPLVALSDLSEHTDIKAVSVESLPINDFLPQSC